MAFWRQNQRNIPPRNGTAPCKNAYPASLTVYGPGGIPVAMENPGSTLPSDGFSARPSRIDVDVSFGDHDALGGALMAVAQADLYLSMPGQPFPRAGTWEEPGAPVAALQMIRLQPSSSAHRGLAAATGPGPAMFFTAPPVFTVQTAPILAVGV